MEDFTQKVQKEHARLPAVSEGSMCRRGASLNLGSKPPYTANLLGTQIDFRDWWAVPL